MSLEPTPTEQAIKAEMEGDVDTAARILFSALVTTPVAPPESPSASTPLDPDTSLRHLLTSALPPSMVPLFFAVWAPRLEAMDLDPASKPGASTRTQHNPAAGAKGGRKGGYSDSVSGGYSDATSEQGKGGVSARPAQGSSSKPNSTLPHTAGTAPSPSPQALLLRHRAALLSNLGCLHLRIGKPLLAGLLFREALAILGSLCIPGMPAASQGARAKQGKAEGAPPAQGGAPAGGASSSAAQGEDGGAVLEAAGRVAYNLGLQQMLCGQHRAAIQSLLAAVAGAEVRVPGHVKVLEVGSSQGASTQGLGTEGGVPRGGVRHDPRVWLRLAECYCIEHRRVLQAATEGQHTRQGLPPGAATTPWPQRSEAPGAVLPGLQAQPVHQGHQGLSFNLVALKSSAGDAGKDKGPGSGSGEASDLGGGDSTGLRFGDARGNPPGRADAGARGLDSEGGGSGGEGDGGSALLRGARCCLLNAMLLLEEQPGNGGKEGGGKGDDEGEERREMEEVLWVLQCHVDLYSDNLLRCIAAGSKALALGARNLAASKAPSHVAPKGPMLSPSAQAGSPVRGETGYSDRRLSRKVVVSLYLAEALSLLRRPLEAQEVLRGAVGLGLPQNVSRVNMAMLQNMIMSS